MKIHSLSKVLYIPLGIAAVAVWFLLPHYGYLKLYALLGAVVPLAAIYIFSGEIDYWWQKKYPMGIDPRAVEWLERYSPFYQSLDESLKEKYENRLSLYLNAREFKMMSGKEQVDLPEDFKLAIAHQAIELTLYREGFLIGDFDRIYCYQHPFPTPVIKQLHTVETEKEDGLILLDIKHALAAITNPNQHYNIAMHGYVDAYLKVYDENLPEVTAEDLAKLPRISGYGIQQIVKVVGHHIFEPDVVMLTLFFTYPEAFGQVFPKLSAKYSALFRQTY